MIPPRKPVILGILRSWVFATNSDFLISISLQPNAVDLRYFKLLIPEVWNIKGLHHKVAKILESDYFSLWQKLNSFARFFNLFVYVLIGNCCIKIQTWFGHSLALILSTY